MQYFYVLLTDNLLITKALNTNHALFLKKCRFYPKLHKIGKVCRGNFNISTIPTIPTFPTIPTPPLAYVPMCALAYAGYYILYTIITPYSIIIKILIILLIPPSSYYLLRHFVELALQ